MLDPSMEELREYVNNYRLNNKPETNTENGTTQLLSDDELLELLESDATTLNMNESPGKAQHLADKTMINNVEAQNCSNVLKVAVNDVEGLTLEIRESFYLKLNSALSSNYKVTFNKKDHIVLTESNISDIAKKIEYGILSTAKDLNSYKFAGADAVVNIEKETCIRNLYKSLFNEIELLRLRNKMQTAATENPQKQPSVLSTEAESLLYKESEFQDAQANTEPMAVDTVNNNSVKLPESQSALQSESEYFSCSSANHSSVESEKNSETCMTNYYNTQDRIITLPKEKQLEEVKTHTDDEIRSISRNDSHSIRFNNNYVKEILTETNNVLYKMKSSNDKVQSDLVCTSGISQKKSRKRKAHCDSGPLTNFLPTVQLSRIKVKNRIKNQELTESERTTSANSRSKEKFAEARLDTNLEKDIIVAEKTLHLENVKHESEYVKTETTLSSPTDLLCNQYNRKQMSLKRDSTNKTMREKHSELKNNDKIDFSGNNNSQNKMNASENIPLNGMYRIKVDIDLSQYSIGIDDEEYIDNIFWDHLPAKHENFISINDFSSNKLDDNTMLQDSENNLKGGSTSSLDTPTESQNNTEGTVTEKESNVPDVNTSTDRHKSSTLEENNCLIDDEAFELERARLDKLCEEMKRCSEETRKCSEETHVDVIHSDYKQIFGIIIPIIRKYYPSEFIPDEVCYGHILQRLQIDLTHADMCDDEKALYIKDSIKTRRYLCDHCIVQ